MVVSVVAQVKRRGKKELVGNPESFTHTVSPTTKLVFDVVQSLAYVAILSPDDCGMGRRSGLKCPFKVGETRPAIFANAPSAGSVSGKTATRLFLFTLFAFDAEDEE
jgi:hypothetical protein